MEDSSEEEFQEYEDSENENNEWGINPKEEKTF